MDMAQRPSRREYSAKATPLLEPQISQLLNTLHFIKRHLSRHNPTPDKEEVKQTLRLITHHTMKMYGGRMRYNATHS